MESEGSAKILALYVLEESQSSGTTSCGFLSSLKPQIYNLNKLGSVGSKIAEPSGLSITNRHFSSAPLRNTQVATASLENGCAFSSLSLSTQLEVTRPMSPDCIMCVFYLTSARESLSR
jgi:hypothetical protein